MKDGSKKEIKEKKWKESIKTRKRKSKGIHLSEGERKENED